MPISEEVIAARRQWVERKEEDPNDVYYVPSPEDIADLERVFAYRPPQGNQIKRYQTLRSRAKQIGDMLLTHCPDSPERDEAKKHLSAFIMHASAAIARWELVKLPE